MHTEILTANQQSLLKLIQRFSDDFYLVGGTAVALHIGHRRSVDFDLFTHESLKRNRIQRIIRESGFLVQDLLYEAYDQMHCIINDVKVTFFNYPFEIDPKVDFDGIIKMPALLDLAAMKVHALGGRSQWKDYVDLYFLLKEHFTVQDIERRAGELYASVFNEKLFREQLSYFEDVDFTEKIDFMDEKISEDIIKDFLTNVATAKFEG